MPDLEVGSVLEGAEFEAKRVATLAARVAAATKSVELGCLAAQLIFPDLRRAQGTRLPDERTAKILFLLRRLCLAQDLQYDPTPDFSSISPDQISTIVSEIRTLSANTLEQNLKSAAYNLSRPGSRSRVVQQLLGSLAQRSIAKVEGNVRTLSIPIEDYDPNYNEEVYNAITTYKTSCIAQHLERVARCRGHSMWLGLDTKCRTKEQQIIFKVLFSDTPAVNTMAPISEPAQRWQQVGLLIESETHSLIHGHSLSPEEFCTLISDHEQGDILLTLYVKDKQLHESKFHSEGSLLDTSDSLSLLDVLEICQLTTETRLMLAYTIAFSVWRFYNSNWMRTRWSSNSIHFVKERSPYSDDETALYIQNACFAVNETSSNEVAETFAGRVAYPYPRLLALCRLLVEVASQRPLADLGLDSEISQQRQINDDAGKCARIVDDEAWPVFDTLNENIRVQYRRIVKACLDKESFRQVIKPGCSAKPSDVEARRRMLYEKVVGPLKSLLKESGHDESHQHRTKLKERNKSDQNLDVYSRRQEAESNFRSLCSADYYARRSAQSWLRDAQQSYTAFWSEFNRVLGDDTYQRTRIAVFDTGYDPKALFFQNTARSNRLKAWKDFVYDNQQRSDEDGHGTQVLSLLMKLAPLADIYVARVARNSAYLEDCKRNVALAIAWAVDNKCSIVSMSFGSDREDRVISNAIYKALADRDGEILFFAAAGNDAGNSRGVMFPAKHEHVIPVYGTNTDGSWSGSLNPPIVHDGRAIYATLAEQVPCSGRTEQQADSAGSSAPTESLDTNQEILATGTSIATAIMAGYAATLLEYAAVSQPRTTGARLDVQSWRNRLTTRRAILELFNIVADLRSDGWRYIDPARYFLEDESFRQSCINLAIARSN